MTIKKEVIIEGVIDICEELNRICRQDSFYKKFNITTGFMQKPKIFSIEKLPLNKKDRGFLEFLGVKEVIGNISMEYDDLEYDDFEFVGKNVYYRANNAE